MSPLRFIVRPENWLWAIHRNSATLTAAPNFAFEFCVNKVDDSAIEGLDLSSLRMRPGVLKNVVLNDIGPVIQVSYLAGIKDYVSGKKVPENWQEAARDLKASMTSPPTLILAAKRYERPWL